jgi:hypothetical protein
MVTLLSDNQITGSMIFNSAEEAKHTSFFDNTSPIQFNIEMEIKEW